MVIKPNKVFIDSNYWIALYSYHDSLGEKAQQIAELIRSEKLEIYISNYVIAEVLTILRLRSNPETVSLFISHVQDVTRKIQILYSSAEDDGQTIHFFENTACEKLSFVDVNHLIQMQKEGISNLITFDKDLVKAAKVFKLKVVSAV
jgi:predicted nucleic acid-binding protein